MRLAVLCFLGLLAASSDGTPTKAVLRAVNDGSLAGLTTQARRDAAARPADPDALATYALCMVWQQRLGMARLDRRPDYNEAFKLRERLEGFGGRPTLGLLLARIEFDRDFGPILTVPGEGKWKTGWEIEKGVLPDGTVKYHRVQTHDYIGPSDEQLDLQRLRVDKAIQMAPNDPEVLLIRAARALKGRSAAAEGLLARAESAGAETILPLSTRLLAWQIRKTPSEKAELIEYVRRTYNERVTRVALRGNKQLADLTGLKP